MMKAGVPPDSRLVFRLLLVVSGVYLISACWHVLHGGLNADEGFYALAARSVWQGELPYRDFGYTQTPLLPYINGLLMHFTGFGLFEQRAINGLWGALTLIMAACWLRRRTNIYWSLGFVALFSVSAPWMYYIHLGKTYAFTGLLMMAALWAYTEYPSGIRKLSILALLGTLGIGCRLPSAPFFALLWFATVFELPPLSMSGWIKAVGFSLLWPALLILPFYLQAWDAAIFWTYDFHRLSLQNRSWNVPWTAIVLLAPSLWLGLFVPGSLILFGQPMPARKSLVWAITTLVALGFNLLPRGVFTEYGIPLLPVLALAAVMALWRAGAFVGWMRHPLVPVGMLLCNISLTIVLQWPFLELERRGTWSMFLTPDEPPFDRALPEAIARARATVESSLTPSSPFIGPELILAVEARRAVPKNLRMGGCATTVDLPPNNAQAFRLATLPEVEAYFTDPSVPLLAMSKNPSNNYVCSMPTFRSSAQFRKFVWSEYFEKTFQVAYEDDEFLILVRKSGTIRLGLKLSR